MYQLSQTFTNYLLSKFKEIFTVLAKDSWLKLVEEIYLVFHDQMIAYFKLKVLNQIPTFFLENSTSFTTQNSQMIFIKKPSEVFLKITFLLENIVVNLKRFMRLKDIQIFMQKMISGIIFMLEYEIFWSYHNKGTIK
jgi:hypothetical protein